jgi:hypothetical protein
MSQQKIIALDIDGVLGDWSSAYLPIVNKLLDKDINYQRCLHHDLAKTYEVTTEKMQEIAKEINNLYDIGKIPLVKGSLEATKKLRQHFDIVIVTSRPDRNKVDTHNWIKKNFGALAIKFTTGAKNPYAPDDRSSKLDACVDIGAVCLVEDNPFELMALAGKQVEPICIAHPWNSEIIEFSPKIFRGNWSEITDYLMKKYACED